MAVDGVAASIQDRMVEQVDQLAEDRIARNAEIKRLREALREIAAYPLGDDGYRDIAEAALRG